jgi:cell division septum initiation protein DivIVA
VVGEREEARARVAQLEHQLAEADARKQAVADALVLAARVGAEHEREREEILAEARQQAEEILSVARAQAGRMIEEAGERSSNLERELRAAGLLAERTRTHLARFVQSLRRYDGTSSPGSNGPEPAQQPAAATTD